ncbi:MAG: PEP-CTERM sorting domain-containing protein [Bryobacteraceae bacterium]
MAAAETPLPAALPLFASGLGALGFAGWRKRRKRTA